MNFLVVLTARGNASHVLRSPCPISVEFQRFIDVDGSAKQNGNDSYAFGENRIPELYGIAWGYDTVGPSPKGIVQVGLI